MPPHLSFVGRKVLLLTLLLIWIGSDLAGWPELGKVKITACLFLIYMLIWCRETLFTILCGILAAIITTTLMLWFVPFIFWWMRWFTWQEVASWFAPAVIFYFCCWAICRRRNDQIPNATF